MYLNFIKWYSLQEAPVKAAVIIGSVTLVTVCLGFFIKDYLIPILLERRKSRNEKVSVFRNYRSPLRESAISLQRRLDEIFRTRAHILWKDNPDSDFYNYKFISTNYRLCALLGWIYAFKLEESYLQVPSKKLHQQITKQLDDFSRSLADGQGVEMYVARTFISQLNIDPSNAAVGTVEKFSVEIDHLVQKAISTESKQLLSETSVEGQNAFLSDLSSLINKQFGKYIGPEEMRGLNLIDTAQYGWD